MKQDKQLEARTFDAIVAANGAVDPFAPAAYDALVAEFVAACRPAAGQLALDIGCGTGEFTRRWAAFGLDVLGMDLSPAAVARAREIGARGVRYEVGDAEHMPVADGTMDVVTFSSVLHHIPDFRPAVCEAFRVLRSGGVCFAFDPNVYAPQMFLLRHPASPLYTSEGVSPQERPLRPSSLYRAFADAGFAVQQHCRAGLPYRHVGPTWARRLLWLYNAYDAILERTRLSRIFGSFVVTVGRKR